MNPKRLLCLALILGGGLSGCSTTDQHRSDANSLKVVVKSEKTRVRVGELLNLALQVENPTTTNQYVRVETCGWPHEWQISNPIIRRPDMVEICEFNPIITETIPAGGSIKFDLEVCVPGPPVWFEHLTGKKLSFQMGFTPIGSKKTFWSREMTIVVRNEN